MRSRSGQLQWCTDAIQHPTTATPVALADLQATIAGSTLRGHALVSDVVDDDRAPGLDADGVLFASRPSRRSTTNDSQRAALMRRAIERGAVAVLVSPEVSTAGLEVPVLTVPDVQTALGPVAAAVHHHPSQQLPVVLVTGTDGKTTTTFMTVAALEPGLGGHVGMLSTIHRVVGGHSAPSSLTTPEAADLQRQLREMVDCGDRAAVMEASSIALVQDRLRGVDGAVGVFTNLTPEHLDVHADIEEYYAAKELLFTGGYVPMAVVNVDVEPGRRVAASATRAGVQVIAVSPGGSQARADLCLIRRIGPNRAEIRVHGTVKQLTTPLAGAHNLANAMCALGAAIGVGANPDDAIAGIAELASVPGRLERVVDPLGLVEAYVDYAHTPAALEATVRAGREIAAGTGGRLWIVVGCGGSRDPHKRGPMGRVVAEGADIAILTSDNPRTEYPEAIVDAMLAGIPVGRRNGVVVELDRAAAISRAVEQAAAGDVIVVAGKGHEVVQVGADRSIPFDDRSVLSAALSARSPRHAPSHASVQGLRR